MHALATYIFRRELDASGHHDWPVMATIQELSDFALPYGVYEDLSDIAGDRRHSPAPKARKQLGEVCEVCCSVDSKVDRAF